VSFTKVILNDGSEHIIRYHHLSIEEAADLEEVTTSLAGKTVALVEVRWWAPADPPKDEPADASATS
jgi:hypothetical protein